MSPVKEPASPQEERRGEEHAGPPPLALYENQNVIDYKNDGYF
jgi:hypothetical protein